MHEEMKMQDFIREAKRVAEAVKSAEGIAVFTHIDADGVTSGSIAYETAKRLGKPVSIEFLKKLDDEAIERIRNTGRTVWINDMGSAYISRFEGCDIIVADHHLPETVPPDSVVDAQGRLTMSTVLHLNPHLYGIDGGISVSSAGISYLISRAVSSDNMDLSPLALVGAVGDLQDSSGRLVGLNRIILEDALKMRLVQAKRDARFYGKETRPLARLLEYSVDPPIPGISGDSIASSSLLRALGIEEVRERKEVTWSSADADAKRKIVSFAVTAMIAAGNPPEVINGMIGETYVLTGEEGILRDIKEFATLLNACGRYGQYDTGIELCIGNRQEALKKALGLLENHRRNISNALRMIREEGTSVLGRIVYFHAQDRMPDTIVGTIAGILTKSGDLGLDRVIVGFAESEGKIKVSARGNEELVAQGLDLSAAIREAAVCVGGIGGGHTIAAGATIEKGKEVDFLEKLDSCIEQQIAARRNRSSGTGN